MTMRTADYACISCILMQGLLLLALPARAAEHWGGSIAITTDSIYRGISQSQQGPAALAGVHYRSPSGWDAALWASSIKVSANADPAYEIDLHAGYTWALSPDWSARIGYVHYAYPKGDGDYDYDELTASLTFQQRISASVAWSANTTRYARWAYAHEKQALAYELSLLQPLHTHWSLCAGAGYYDLRELFDTGYWFWSAGMAFTWEALQVDVLRIDTDATADRLFGRRGSGSRWTAALSWRF